MRLPVSPGAHRLGFEAEGWTTAGRIVTVGAHEQRVVTLVLTPLPATLVFDVQTPGAQVRLDNQPVPMPSGEHRVAAGRHRLTATRPGYLPYVADLVVVRGERLRIPITLSPAVQE